MSVMISYCIVLSMVKKFIKIPGFFSKYLNYKGTENGIDEKHSKAFC